MMLFKVGIWLNYTAPKQQGGKGTHVVSIYFVENTILDILHLSSKHILSTKLWGVYDYFFLLLFLGWT